MGYTHVSMGYTYVSMGYTYVSMGYTHRRHISPCQGYYQPEALKGCNIESPRILYFAANCQLITAN
jgi:hypothetical protein